MKEFTQAHQAVLKKQQITDKELGTILADFESLLDFVGVGGVESSGKNCRIPLAALGALDERMTHPLRPRLERPQQLSYPNVNGLYLLLRNTGLGVSSGHGERARLAVQPGRLEEWRRLNPEERYFTLFETLVTADWGVIDSEKSSSSGELYMLENKVRVWCQRLKSLKKGGIPASQIYSTWKDQAVAALLELFGIIEILRVEPHQGENWRITKVRKTDFGDALFARLRDVMLDHLLRDSRRSDESGWLGEQFRDYFPNCVNTLPTSELELVAGVWQFKVSLGKVWRRIVIPADRSAEELVDGILQAIRFDSDHMYELRLRDRSGREMRIAHPQDDDAELYSDEFAIGYLPLDPGQSMTFLFDYGDNWEFDVKLEKILPEGAAKKLKVIERQGKSPKQYDYDDGW